ncbi:MAG: hypothetical protein LLG37_08530 [Spirochaetia bacterium]|nr:hypothetical protein [Spirochaetia bacterium]
MNENERFLRITKRIQKPDASLHKVPYVDLKRKSDFYKLPKTSGCYWIWTNEKVLHSFHKHPFPAPIAFKLGSKTYSGEIIYNGVADNIRDRAMKHLCSAVNQSWSGISVDVFMGKRRVKSHKKKVFSKKGKVPFYDGKRIRSLKTALLLNLSNGEKKHIRTKTSYFRNGINVFQTKHKKNKFRLYYISGIDNLYRDLIEKKWRENNNTPKLCSYSKGR